MALKGKTKIELFRKGKPVLTHEESNMVTNMTSDILTSRVGPAYFAGNGYLDPSTFYKGLLMFTDSIPETASAYGMPGNNNLIARGYESSTLSSDLDTGIFNTNLSTQTNTRISYVWDFDEEHGNGRISCVCLAPQNTAKMFRKSFNSGNYTFPPNSDGFTTRAVFTCRSSTDTPIYFDATNQVMYSIKLSETGILTIYKNFMNKLRPLTGSYGLRAISPSVDQNDSIRLYTDTYYETVATVDVSSIITAGGTYSFMECDKNGYLYLCATNTQTVATNGTLHIAKVNIKTGTVTDYTLINYSNESLKLTETGLSGQRKWRPYDESFTVFNGYFWFVTTSNHIIAINTETNSDYHICTTDGTTALTVTTFSYTSFGSSWKGGFMNLSDGDYTRYNGLQFMARFVPVGVKSLAILSRYDDYVNQIFAINTDTFIQETYVNNAYMFANVSWYTCYPGNQVVSSDGRSLRRAGYHYNNNSPNVYNTGCYFFQPLTWGLHTINNLETPVTKTADLTMRVTYILEEDDS